jgi:hypothetical protein
MSASRTLPALAALLCFSSAQSAELKLPRDGWVSWEVPAVENAPASCCWTGMTKSTLQQTTCQLDEKSDGQNRGSRDETTDAVKIYVRLAGGKVEKLHSLSASCPVAANGPIQSLTTNEDDSARWLIAQAKQGADARRSIGQNALAALAIHRSETAGNAMVDFARNDPREETRKWSVFWLSLMRGAQGAEITSSVMFTDPEAEVRKHAAFALAQSKTPRVAADLTRLGNTDKAGDVRAQAWFWLAQTGLPATEAAISGAVRQDPEDHVREQAVFALSQLPDERATRALIAIAEDRSLPREQRKRAVFWLSQSQVDSAQAYLEQVLARSASR